MELLFYMKNKCLYKLEYMICLCDELVAKQAKVFNAWIGEGRYLKSKQLPLGGAILQQKPQMSTTQSNWEWMQHLNAIHGWIAIDPTKWSSNASHDTA